MITTKKSGFTLMELLIVIGILAVLIAIAIPILAGQIDKANRSSDNTNAVEMTNAVERFTSEYKMYSNDILSNKVDVNNLDATQGRVYNVTKATTQEDIQKLESKDGLNGIRLDPDTKYPANEDTAKSIIDNYTKTSSSTYEPKQSDCHYYYSPDVGVVVTQPTDNAKVEQLNALIKTGNDAKGQPLDDSVTWIDLTDGSVIENGKSETPDISKPETNVCTHISTIVKNEIISTCSTTGYTGDTYCTTCGNKLSEGMITAKKPHNYSKVGVVEASCTTAGNTGYYKCDVCGFQNGSGSSIASLGHNLELKTRQESTCTSNGYEEYNCIRCDYSETKTLDKSKNHGTTFIANKTNPSCLTDGYTGDTVCSVCNNITKNGSPVTKLGHNIQTQNITATYSGDKICTRCGLIIEKGISIKPHINVIPAGGELITKNGEIYSEGDSLPQSLSTGDVYKYGNYNYAYNQYWNSQFGWKDDTSLDGWGVRCVNNTQYPGEILSNIGNKPIVSMYSTFNNCGKLLVSPEIPDTVISLYGTFTGCSALTTAPKIPNGVKDMYDTFCNAYALKTYHGSTDADGDFSNYTIPNTVTNMSRTFYQCRSLKKAPALSNSAGNIGAAFYGCTSLQYGPSSIPASVTNMNAVFYNCTSLLYCPDTSMVTRAAVWQSCFYNCKSMKTAPVLSDGSTSNIISLLQNCSSLTGTITINANVNHWTKCLYGTNITNVVGTTPKAQCIMLSKTSTANNPK